MPGDTDVVQALIELGANINSKDEYGNTPLHNAIAKGHVNTVHALIKNGANLNAEDETEDTPLHIAAIFGNRIHIKFTFQSEFFLKFHFSGHVKLIQDLIANGANISVTNKNGETPLHHASFRGIRAHTFS